VLDGRLSLPFCTEGFLLIESFFNPPIPPVDHDHVVSSTTYSQLLGSNSIVRRARHTASGALLVGKLYDDRGQHGRLEVV
jgi:hypothetical protein